MNDANITLETPHEQWWVEHTFEDTFQHSLAIHCYHGHKTGHGQQKKVEPVLEVWMCFDKQLQPFDCPANVRRKCHGDVIFPSLDSLAGTTNPVPCFLVSQAASIDTAAVCRNAHTIHHVPVH